MCRHDAAMLSFFDVSRMLSCMVDSVYDHSFMAIGMTGLSLLWYFHKICTRFCFAWFCFGYIIIFGVNQISVYLCSSRLLPWHCSNHMAAPESFLDQHYWKCFLDFEELIRTCQVSLLHYCDVIMGAMSSQITSLTVVYSTVYSDVDQRKHQSSASLAFVRGIHRRPVNSPHKWPVTRKMFPFDNVIMIWTKTSDRLFVFSFDSFYDLNIRWTYWIPPWSAYKYLQCGHRLMYYKIIMAVNLNRSVLLE